MFAECCGADLPAYCHRPLWVPECFKLSQSRKMKVGTNSLETDVHWIAVRKASGQIILGGTDMVQITSRATKDCSYLYEIPPSRVAKQVIGPRFPPGWLYHWSDENLVVRQTY